LGTEQGENFGLESIRAAWSQYSESNIQRTNCAIGKTAEDQHLDLSGRNTCWNAIGPSRNQTARF
jgi:hypothetical protein